MQTTTIAHAKLRLSENNVRKANGDAGLEALAASIAEHGLLQPLIVSPSAGKKTLFDVHAGGRRWRAIGLLIERGTLPKDYAIDVRLCENEDAAAREISLAENLLREAMTPADEARAYKDIIAGGTDAEAVARRFGVTVRHVQGRLRLADLAEPIFAALTEGEITLDVAMAYGSTGDRDRQEAAWERLSTSWQADNPQAIRRAIAEEALSADRAMNERRSRFMATPRSLTGQSKSMVVHDPTSPLMNDRQLKPICDQKGTNQSVRNYCLSPLSRSTYSARPSRWTTQRPNLASA